MAAPSQQAPSKPPVWSAEQRYQLAAYIASLGPGEAIPTKSEYDPADAGTEEIVRGGELFRKNCTACHNFAGSGGALPGGKYAPSLRRGQRQAHLRGAAHGGRSRCRSSPTPCSLPQDKRDIISYLNKNEESPGYGGFSLGALGPVSEGLFAWLVGIGVLVGFAVWIAAHSARVKKKPA